MNIAMHLPKSKKSLVFAGLTIIAGAIALGVSNSLNNDELVNASDNNNLPSIMPSDMIPLSLTKVFEGSEVDSTINSTQSFAITDKYFIAVQAHSVNEDSGYILATDLNAPNTGPKWATHYDVGHGNGTTWNRKTNQIVIIDGKDRLFFNANTGQFESKATVSSAVSGIAYDYDDDKYIQTVGSGKSSGQILTNDFTLLSTFDAGHGLVNQDVAYYDGFIYRIAWAGCEYLRQHGDEAKANYCNEHFGENSNALYKFDMNGDFVDAFYINVGYGELEGLDFGPDGTPYLMFNGSPDYLHYSVYKVSNQEALDKMKGKSAVTITFPNNSITKTYGDASFTNTATTNSDGNITYKSSATDVAMVNATTGAVTIKGTGTATITATVAETVRYKSAVATYTLTVNKAKGTVSFVNSSITKSIADNKFTNPATITGDGAITYSSNKNSVAEVNNTGEVTIKGVGTATITATLAASKNCSGATASYTLTVNANKTTISFSNNSVTKTYGDAGFTNAATTNSDGSVTYASSANGVATVNAATGAVTIKGAGTATITATVAKTARYDSANATYTLTVNKKPSTKPAEADEIKTAYYKDKLSTIVFKTVGLRWEDGDTTIELNQNKYKAIYVENNDSANYQAVTYDIMVQGIRKTYTTIEGNGQIVIVNSTDTAEYTNFKIDANYDLFANGGEVYIDQEKLDQNHYRSESGSTIISIENDYLDALALGNHNLSVYFNDGGIATATFTVKENEVTPPTPDPTPTPDPSESTTPSESQDSSAEKGATEPASPNTGGNSQNETYGFQIVSLIPPIMIFAIGVVIYIIKTSRSHRRFH